MSASIEIKNVTKKYGNLTVLDNLSLHIAANEFIVFLGPSGCGKSTLLRLIAGLETLTEGEILINGERIDTLPPGARGVAMVFQNYALYPHMTVSKNMSFGLENIGEDKQTIAQKVQNAAEILEIDHLLDRKPAQLSGGQRQRVAIGRAIVKEPKAFLFDEPLSNLDALLRSRTRLELAQLHHRLKSTMVFVTHDQVEAMTLADRIVIMNNRVIEQIGTPVDVYRRPATKFVAGFVGSPAMNFLNAKSVDFDGLTARATLGGNAVIETNILSENLMKDGAFSVGIRAEDLDIVDSENSDIRVQVEVVERLGERTLIYCRQADGVEIVADDEGNSSIKVGDEIHLKFKPSGVHLFDSTGLGHHGAE
ncbi:MAG: sn-glycerol-3-phosphate ABC transporter ATP-binding protein UgpC [Alphaproteobacteria bacterium]|nr:sn-glycerol-3-phosphate ABC transporter ATP-binding protein UgpC [Alphaproteobacteria bacterium]